MAKFNLKSGNNIGGRNGDGVLFKKMGSSPVKHTKDYRGYPLPRHKEPHKDFGPGMASYLRSQGLTQAQIDVLVADVYKGEGLSHLDPNVRAKGKKVNAPSIIGGLDYLRMLEERRIK